MPSRRDIEHATALVSAAIQMLKQAQPVMRLVISEPVKPTDSELRAATALVAPIFRAALTLLREHDRQLGHAAAALEKVRAGA